MNHHGWRQQAACRAEPAEVFFRQSSSGTREAREVCGTCPVDTACLSSAILDGEIAGIWGGLPSWTLARVRSAVRQCGAAFARTSLTFLDSRYLVVQPANSCWILVEHVGLRLWVPVEDAPPAPPDNLRTLRAGGIEAGWWWLVHQTRDGELPYDDVWARLLDAGYELPGGDRKGQLRNVYQAAAQSPRLIKVAPGVFGVRHDSSPPWEAEAPVAVGSRAAS